MYHYTESGLRNVWLANGYKPHVTPHGKGVAFANIAGLHLALGRWLCAYRQHLTGAEFRFLRQELDLSQAGLASLLGNDAQSVALWEKGKVKVPAWADRLIRALIESVANLEAEKPRVIRVEARETRKGWTLKAA